MTKELEGFKQVVGEKSALYLTGSRLLGLQDEKSDTDFMGFYVPTKNNLFLKSDNARSKHYQGDCFEGAYMDVFHLVNLVQKVSPNLVELLTKQPLYTCDELEPLTTFLYQNQKELVNYNKKKLFMSYWGLMKRQSMLLNPDKTFAKTNTFGKVLFNLLKSYRMACAVAHNESVLETVNSFKELKPLKESKEFPTEYLAEHNLEAMLDEVQTFATAESGEVSQTSKDFLNKLVELTPAYC